MGTVVAADATNRHVLRPRSSAVIFTTHALAIGSGEGSGKAGEFGA